MKTGLYGALALALLATGCHYRERVNQDLWERELRLQEDCIDRLRWQLEDSQYALAEANRKIDTLKKEVDVLRGEEGAPPAVPHSILGPTEDERGEAPRVPPAPRLPAIEPGLPFTPGETGTGFEPSEESLPPPSASRTRVSPASHSSVNRAPLVERLDPDAEVDRIVIDSDRSGGLNTDGRPGDDVLSVVIEQFDKAGERVLAPGDITIVVVDPALDGDEGRIARWQFDAEEVEKQVRRNREGGAICYELPWPTPPQHSDLRLFVRFATFDGRRLEADLPIDVQLPSDTTYKDKTAKAGSYDSDAEESESEMAESNARPEKTARRPTWSPYR